MVSGTARVGPRRSNDLLARTRDFDAVFALNDTLALGAIRAITAHGLRIPDDIAMAGFDNIDEAEYSTPTLTTVDPNRVHIARTAVDLLVRRMGGDDSEHEELVAPFELHIRESTAG